MRSTTDHRDGPNLKEYSFTLDNESTKHITTFLGKKNYISAYFFNPKFQLQSRLFSKNLAGIFKIPLGGNINGKTYSLFYPNETKNKFSGILFDFEKNTTDGFEIDLNLKKEIFLSSFVHSSKFYLLTGSYRENKMYLYHFNNTGRFERRIIDLSNYEFFGVEDYPSRLKNMLALSKRSPLTEITLVQSGVPYSLDSLHSLIKL